MPSIRDLLARVRADIRIPEPLADAAPPAPEPAENDHHAPATPPTKPDETPRTIAVSPKPPETPPHLAPDPIAATSTARLQTPSGRPRVSKRKALAEVLGKVKAGQALWAPEKLTRREREIAARVIAEVEEANRG